MNPCRTFTKPLAAALLVAALAPAAGQSGPINLSDPQAMAQLEKDLASDDFAQRQRGQETLDHIPADQRETLRKLAQKAADPEVKARFLARVDVLEELALTDPPGISFAVKGATLAEVAAALSKAQPAQLTADTNQGRIANDLFTLKADNLPFWEIERQLSDQYPVWFESTAAGNKLVRDYRGWRQSVRVRGFEVCVQEPRLPDPQGVSDRNISLPIGSAAKYVCVMGLGLDPRIPVASIGIPKASAVDNKGNRWNYSVLDPHPGPKPAKVIVLSRTLALEPPPNPGETLTIAGHWPVTLQLGEQRVEWNNFDEPPEDSLRLGSMEITVDRLILISAAQGVYNLQVTTEVTTAAGASPTAVAPAAITMSLLDGDGNVITSRAVATDTLKSSATISLKTQPRKLVFSMPGRTREFLVPFEFKNLAIAP